MVLYPQEENNPRPDSVERIICHDTRRRRNGIRVFLWRDGSLLLWGRARRDFWLIRELNHLYSFPIILRNYTLNSKFFVRY